MAGLELLPSGHLGELRLHHHLLGHDRRLDPVEEAFEPADELGVGDPQFSLGRRVLGVEGPGWLVADFDERWANPVLRHDMMTVARAVESEPTMLGVSAHLLAVGKKPVPGVGDRR